ncbi:MAG: EscU/YscU/HrcU family type III secretion system export apparatus switch protein [Planctomycetes bacterium]|nr:EscU/YscU/HrcU family type III secretion system export apparatus switch protein [Planctomycetota bacterium]
MLGDSAERIHPPTLSKREHVLAQGHGPRAVWLASFLGIMFFGAITAVAAPMQIRSLLAMARRLFLLTPSDKSASLLAEAIEPALWLVAFAFLAALLAHAASHWAWIRMGPWKMRPRTSILSRIGPVFAGLVTAVATLAASLAFAWPWLANISNWSRGSLSSVLGSALGMIGMTALGAAIVLFAASLLQRFKARSTFEAGIRLTRAEAKEAARESGEGRATRRRPQHPRGGRS